MDPAERSQEYGCVTFAGNFFHNNNLAWKFFIISIFKFLNQVLKLCSHDTFSAVQKVAIQARLDDIAEKEKQRLDSIKRAVDLVAAWKAE